VIREGLSLLIKINCQCAVSDLELRELSPAQVIRAEAWGSAVRNRDRLRLQVLFYLQSWGESKSVDGSVNQSNLTESLRMDTEFRVPAKKGTICEL
jgi:hypothetical protein